MWSGNFKTAVSSLRMAKWRSLLTMLGIIIGVSSVVTIVSLGEGLKHQIVGQINTLGSNVLTIRSGKLISSGASGKGDNLNLLAFLSASTLTDKDITALNHLPSLSAVVPFDFVTNSASADNHRLDNVYVVGTSPDMTNVLNQSVAYGSFLSADDNARNFAVIGNDIAHNLFGEFNPVGQSLSLSGRDFTVSGVLAPSSGGLLSVAQTDFNSAVFIPYSTAIGLTSGHSDILQILTKVKDGQNVDNSIASIQKTLERTHGADDFSVLKQYQLLNIAGGVVSTVTAFISGIAAISLLVGGIGIMDIMLVSVSERTREIGIRKAVGATNRQILNQFLVEGLALTIGGGLIGIIVSLLINTGLRVYTHWKPAISWPVVVLAVGISVIVGIIFSIAPALKAARKNPIDALRS